MICVCSIYTKDSSKPKSVNIDLDVDGLVLGSSALDNKFKAFANAYASLTDNYAKICEIKPKAWNQKKPDFVSGQIPSLKIMYKTTKKDILNVSIPYLDENYTKTELENFVMLYLQDFAKIEIATFKKII